MSGIDSPVTDRPVVVVGNGTAAHRLVESLVRLGHRGPVTVLGAEPVAAYHRAGLLSVLDGTLPPGALSLAPAPPGVRVLTSAPVTGIDRARRRVRTADGSVHPYGVLVLATGARPRPPGFDAPGVRTLRSLADAAPPPEGPVVVAGGGLRGVAAAAALRRCGHEVTLVHPGPRLAHRDLEGPAAAVLAHALEESGVLLETGRRVVGREEGKALLDDGRVLAAATLLVCAGEVPETGPARTAGLRVRRGIVVDDRLRTSDPLVHAIGDCAEAAGAPGSSLASAWEQADALAALLTGTDTPYRPARRVLRPGVAGLDLTVVGPRGAFGAEPVEGEETVTLSDPARGRYARLRLRGDRIHSGTVVGFPRAVAAVGRLYAGDRPVQSDRLALLLGSAGGYAASGELPETAVICQCNGVTRKALTQAWHQGARELPALAAATRATTGCGTCLPAVRRLCGQLAEAPDPDPDPEVPQPMEGTANG
ncbi:FAD-dependent oxidoreductase [Streptomyces sp. NBC_00249]|uniref:FAD-dependent oxidoreductase n=1 Tax=Streptomyces sp. NBC_00249 TaxID=2975690 RepID=UPI002251344D|nr:FAD-dependent oxidoreductase [Streptomyces sp. NBC_00249]MCX5197284.1 FAD-dependent oxidoreductase [Streptomyces sp. NBC_00249]